MRKYTIKLKNASECKCKANCDAMGRGGGQSQIDLTPARLLSFDAYKIQSHQTTLP